jgi:hypothetical protein
MGFPTPNELSQSVGRAHVSSFADRGHNTSELTRAAGAGAL